MKMHKYTLGFPGIAKWILLVVAGVLILLWPAFYNGFPLVFSDTGTYIESAFTLIPPVDRGIGYGLFLRMTSFGVFPWAVVVAQAMLLVYLMIRCAQLFWKGIQPSLLLAILLGVGLFTSLPWFSSQLMVDVFTPVMILATGLFLFGEYSIWEKLFLGFLIAFCLTVHSAHPLILLFMVAVTALHAFRVFSSGQQVLSWYKRMAVVAGILIMTTFGVMSWNNAQYELFSVNPAGHAFLMARLSETPLLKSYLDENCSVHEWRLCTIAAELPYATVDDFLWSDHSLGKVEGWLPLKSEFDQVMSRIFINPLNLGYFVMDSLGNGAQLLTHFSLDSFYPQKETSSPYSHIQKYFPNDLKSFKAARQFKDELYLLGPAEVLQFVSFLFGCVAIIYYAFKGFGSQGRPFLLLVFAGFFVNAFFMGGLSAVVGRYQARVAWIVPFIALVLFFSASQNVVAHRTRARK